MFLDVFPTGPLQANCILIGCRQGGKLAVIDPGDEAELIEHRILASGLTPTMILHTHGHFDHAGATGELWQRLGEEIQVGLHREELAIYRNLPMLAQMFGYSLSPGPEPTLLLEHEQTISLGQVQLEVRHTPGHSPGSVCFVGQGAAAGIAVVGDLVFAGSVGRTDLPGGAFSLLERSIREQVYTLEETTRLITGHGPETTVGAEKASNPFVRP